MAVFSHLVSFTETGGFVRQWGKGRKHKEEEQWKDSNGGCPQSQEDRPVGTTTHYDLESKCLGIPPLWSGKQTHGNRVLALGKM